MKSYTGLIPWCFHFDLSCVLDEMSPHTSPDTESRFRTPASVFYYYFNCPCNRGCSSGKSCIVSVSELLLSPHRSEKNTKVYKKKYDNTLFHIAVIRIYYLHRKCNWWTKKRIQFLNHTVQQRTEQKLFAYKLIRQEVIFDFIRTTQTMNH